MALAHGIIVSFFFFIVWIKLDTMPPTAATEQEEPSPKGTLFLFTFGTCCWFTLLQYHTWNFHTGLAVMVWQTERWWLISRHHFEYVLIFFSNDLPRMSFSLREWNELCLLHSSGYPRFGFVWPWDPYLTCMEDNGASLQSPMWRCAVPIL